MTSTPRTRAPRAFRITDNVPPGAEVRLSSDALRLLVQFFGEEALRRAGIPVKEPNP